MLLKKQQKTKRKVVNGRQPVSGVTKSSSFAGFLKPLIPKPDHPVAGATLLNAPLAHLDYAAELKAKDEALRLFWKYHKNPGCPEQVVPSPKPLGYRTTSKRKTVLRGSTLCLLFGDKEALSQKSPFLESPLEPAEHAHIYKFLQKKLSEPAFRLAASHLNYLIIRGTYSERVVIFNVDTLNGPLVRKLKILAGHLQKLPEPVSAAFVYPDPSGSDYYLESRRPEDLLHFKKIFGPAQLAVTYGGCRYRFHPTSFSQVNESMVEVMLKKALELLSPAPHDTLLDLYCGYGLFSHFLAPSFRQVLGIDSEGPSIRAAMENSRLNKKGSSTQFLARRITGKLFEEGLHASFLSGTVVLDPPRQGPQDGVIQTISQYGPQKVLHVFCGVDQIPASLKEWQASGYDVKHIIPLDMFPGTTNLEILILLEPSALKN
jgi:tRNA/tmRNA/rRNA uracil-C5-methylase (TrmA/RlmC/RlmD family)